jgi:cytochrome c biogenesis protein
MNNLFRSWWFILLLTLLAMNLLACLISRTPPIITEWRRSARKKAFVFSISDPRPLSDIKNALTPVVSSLLNASCKEVLSGAELTLTWVKHRIHLLGFPFMHIAVLLILAGGLIGLSYGYKGHVLVEEGDATQEFTLTPSGEKRSLPFQIAVDKFTLARYPTGEPKEFRSDVRLLENGIEAVKGSILVNHPLTYRSISLYQSDYRVLGVKTVDFLLESPDGKKEHLSVEPGTAVGVPGADSRIRLLSLDPGSTKKGAGAEIAVEAPGREARKVGVFERDAAPIKIGEVGIRFMGYRPFYATGLQIGYDPGSHLVWVGCCLLVLGFSLTLFTNHRHLTIKMKEAAGFTKVEVSGASRKQRREYREMVEQTMRRALESSEGDSDRPLKERGKKRGKSAGQANDER